MNQPHLLKLKRIKIINHQEEKDGKQNKKIKMKAQMITDKGTMVLDLYDKQATKNSK